MDSGDKRRNWLWIGEQKTSSAITKGEAVHIGKDIVYLVMGACRILLNESKLH